MAAVEVVSTKHVLALAAALALAAGCWPGAGSSQPSPRGVPASPSPVVTYRPTARPVTAARTRGRVGYLTWQLPM